MPLLSTKAEVGWFWLLVGRVAGYATEGIYYGVITSGAIVGAKIAVITLNWMF